MAASSNQINAESVKSMTLDQLLDMRDEYQQHASGWAALVGILNVELASRAQSAIEAAFAQQNKQSGKLSIEMPGGIEFIGDRKKTVKWDSAKLLPIAGSLDWAQAQKLFKIEVSVPENTYKGMEATNPELKKQIDEARTVDYKLGVTVTRKGS